MQGESGTHVRVKRDPRGVARFGLIPLRISHRGRQLMGSEPQVAVSPHELRHEPHGIRGEATVGGIGREVRRPRHGDRR